MSTAANSDAGIEQLLRAENELLPPRSLVENARLKDYAAEYQRSVDDPERIQISPTAKQLAKNESANKRQRRQ